MALIFGVPSVLYSSGGSYGQRSWTETRTKARLSSSGGGIETGTYRLFYDPKNVAEFTYLGDGKFGSKMYWECCFTRMFELEGKKTSQGTRREKGDQHWKKEYRRLNEAHYHSERGGPKRYRRDGPGSDTSGEDDA